MRGRISPGRVLLAAIGPAVLMGCTGSESLGGTPDVFLRFPTQDMMLHTDTIEVAVVAEAEWTCSSLLAEARSGDLGKVSDATGRVSVCELPEEGLNPSEAGPLPFDAPPPRGPILHVALVRHANGELLGESCRLTEGTEEAVMLFLQSTTLYNREYAPVAPPCASLEEKCNGCDDP